MECTIVSGVSRISVTEDVLMFFHISGSNRLINKLAIKIFSVSHICVVDLCSVIGGWW